MKKRINDKWTAILLCASFLWTLAAAIAPATAAVATTTTTTSSTIMPIPTTTSMTTTTATMTSGSSWTSATATATNSASDVDNDEDTIDEIACPAIPADSCSCYVFDDELHLECPNPTMAQLRQTLATFGHLPIRSLSIYNLDKSTTTIKADDFPKLLHVYQLHISLCAINQLTEDSFRHIREHLESLAIESGQLRAIPRKTLPYMMLLRAVSFEANKISELPDYSFYGLRLAELNLKSNALHAVGENAFAGLEETLELADLSANLLTNFPTVALRRLRCLATIKLAWNSISSLPDDGYTLLRSLRHVDLSSNHFTSIGEDAFRPLSRLHTLLLYNNGVEVMHRCAFASLVALRSLDLSHNQLVHIDADTFRSNLLLETIDLSHNHLHRIDGLFANLVQLRQLFLDDNNVLEVPPNSFDNATALDVLHLQRNAIRHVNQKAFTYSSGSSRALRQLFLGENFVAQLPVKLLAGCSGLLTLNLDRNRIVELLPGSLASASALRELRLQANHITRIDCGVFEPLRHLIELDLQDNAIAAIETGAFATMRSLQYVNLRGNVLRELGDIFLPHATSLVAVYLDGNQLEKLHTTTLAAQTIVETVRLDGNRLTRLEYAHLANLQSMRNLYATNNLLSVVEDGALKAMRSLLVLDLSVNQLQAVSGAMFAGLEALRELRLASNHLEVITNRTFEHLSHLQLLDLSANRLKAIETPLFHPNAPLKRLLLHNNQLIAIDWSLLTPLRHLDELDIHSNQLTDDIFSHLRSDSLRLLDLSANNLTQLSAHSLDNLPALQELRVEDGQLMQIESGAFLHATHLELFFASRNRLRHLPDELFQTTHHLRSIRLDENLLTVLPSALLSAVSIHQLSAAANRIGNLIDMCAFQPLRNLAELNLSGNAIATLVGLNRCNLTRLSHLDLSANALTTLPADAFCSAVSLRSIDLSANRFAHLPLASFARCQVPAIERLIFDNNPVSQIATRIDSISPSLPETSSLIQPQFRVPLRELVVRGCSTLSAIGSADFNPFDGLEHLCLARNAIARISVGTFRSLTVLTTLDLGHNRIVSLQLQWQRGLRALRMLNLTHNTLSRLDSFDNDLQALQTLDLSYNRLTAIDRFTFHQLVNLTELRLQGNRITQIAADAFRWLRGLRTLNLATNQMRLLPLEAFKPVETQLRTLILGENGLVCGCAQEEAWQWLRDHEKMLCTATSCGYEKDNDNAAPSSRLILRCDQPIELRGQPFLQMEPSTFCSSPLLVRVAVHDIRSASVNVSWEAHDYSHLCAYRIFRSIVSSASHPKNSTDQPSDNNHDDVVEQRHNNQSNGQLEDGNARWTLVTQLIPKTRYSICVIGLSDERQSCLTKNVATNSSADNSPLNSNCQEHNDCEVGKQMTLALAPQWSRCIETRTLNGGGNRANDEEQGASLLTRRLGLIIGSCMGCVVFAALAVVLVYTKLRKQRRNAKNQQPLPPEYLSYRHFSLLGSEQQSSALGHSIAASGLVSIAFRR